MKIAGEKKIKELMYWSTIKSKIYDKIGEIKHILDNATNVFEQSVDRDIGELHQKYVSATYVSPMTHRWQ